MSIASLSKKFQTLNVFPNAGGKPEDYPPIVNELVLKYKDAWRKKDQPKLDAFKIPDVIKPLPAIQYQKVKLKIRMSTIPNAGLGIFANDTIPKGKIIGSYGGPLPVLDREYLKTKINLGEGALFRSKYEEELHLSEKQRNYTMKYPVRYDEMDNVDYYCVYPTEKQLTKHEELVTKYKECRENNMCIKHLKDISKNMNWTALINDACDPYKNNVKVIENGYLNTDKEIQAGEELFLEYGSEYWGDEKPYVTLDVFNTIIENSSKISEKLKQIDLERAIICISSDSDSDSNTPPPPSKRHKSVTQKTISDYFPKNHLP